MPTTPLSIVNRLMGVEAWTDPVAFAGGSTIGGTPVDSAGSTVVVPPATTTLTLTHALHANRMLNIASTGGLAITPPAATGTFDTYTFVITATISGGNLTIDAKAGNASDVFTGNALQNKVGTVNVSGPAATTNLLTFNGTTQGGIAGDIITMQDVALHCWNVFINGSYSGTFSSPFSNH